jgi:hypothetical protein
VPGICNFRNLSLSEITAKIDWLILNDYLRVEYDDRLSLPVYTNKGWEIERDTYSDGLLKDFGEMIETDSSTYDMTHLRDRPRDMIFLLLDKIEKSEDSRFIPLLEAWKAVDYKKVHQRIHEVIQSIRDAERISNKRGVKD